MTDMLERPVEAPVKIHKMTIPWSRGSKVTTWRTDDPTSVAVARQEFHDALASGFLPFTITESGGRGGGEVIRQFEPEADEIRMTVQYQGG